MPERYQGSIEATILGPWLLAEAKTIILMDTGARKKARKARVNTGVLYKLNRVHYYHHFTYYALICLPELVWLDTVQKYTKKN